MSFFIYSAVKSGTVLKSPKPEDHGQNSDVLHEEHFEHQVVHSPEISDTNALLGHVFVRGLFPRLALVEFGARACARSL